MRARTRRAGAALATAGGVVLLRPGTRANRVLRRQLDGVTRRLRYLTGRLQGVSYRLRARHPDPDVSDLVLTDRIRSSIGPLEKRLDLPHIHVLVEDHVALLHGVAESDREARELEAAVAAVSGVLGVESYLHVGLTRGDTRPSAGRRVEQPSDARRRLLDTATRAGLDPAVAEPVVGRSSPPSPNDCPTASVTTLPPTSRPTFEPCSHHHAGAGPPAFAPSPSLWPASAPPARSFLTTRPAR